MLAVDYGFLTMAQSTMPVTVGKWRTREYMCQGWVQIMPRTKDNDWHNYFPINKLPTDYVRRRHAAEYAILNCRMFFFVLFTWLSTSKLYISIIFLCYNQFLYPTLVDKYAFPLSVTGVAGWHCWLGPLPSISSFSLLSPQVVITQYRDYDKISFLMSRKLY